MFRKAVPLVTVTLLGLATVWWWWSHATSATWGPALNSREVATRVLAAHLARRYPEAKALIIGNPFTQRSGQSSEIYAFDKAEAGGFAKGFGSKRKTKEVFPALRPEFLERPDSVFIDPRTTTPVSFLVAEDAFQHLAESNQDFDLIVSLIGFPVNLRQSRLWLEPGKPRLALLLPDWRLVGSREVIRDAVKSEKIAAAVIARPGSSPETEAAVNDDNTEFDRQFLLLTKDNLDELLQTYPHLF
jgi:hypothetical protein